VFWTDLSVAMMCCVSNGLLRGQHLQIVISVTGGADDHFDLMSEEVSSQAIMTCSCL